MKKFNYFCIASVFLLLFISVISCADLYDSFEVNTIIYVSERGSANGDGTENSPFNTLQLAINKINASSDTSATWTILIDGTINSGKATINSLNAAKLVIKKHHDSSVAKITGSGADSGPLLKVMAPADIEIENVVFRGGSSTDNGGGLYIDNSNAIITINQSNITECHANYGAGIYVGHGTLILNNCSLTLNGATSAGGAIYNSSGIVTLNETTYANNTPSDSEVYGI